MQFSEMILSAPAHDNLKKSIKNLNKEIELLNKSDILSQAQDSRPYAVNNQGRIIFREYSRTLKEVRSLRKDSERFYALIRRKYLGLLIELLEYKQDPNSKTTKEHTDNVKELDKLMANLEKAGVNMPRIMLSAEQYDWAKSGYRKKRTGSVIKKYVTSGGVETRSKSEQKLGSRFEYFGMPYRYEMKITVNVEELVKELEKELKATGWLKNRLFYYDGNECIWNVPARYAWMNEKGSMWKSFDAKSDLITIYPDFIFKLRDGSLLVWEHEGMTSNFRYRCNASERIFVLRETGTVAENNLVFSFERDINDEEEMDRMIMTHLIPRILF